jgi:hypothetical protein
VGLRIEVHLGHQMSNAHEMVQSWSRILVEEGQRRHPQPMVDGESHHRKAYAAGWNC